MNLSQPLLNREMLAEGTKIVEAEVGVPIGNRAGFAHKVDFALEDLETGTLGARWKCGQFSPTVELFETPPNGREQCSRCFVNRVTQQVVYFIEKDGLVKIGWSSDLYSRAAAIGGKLLAFQPGNRQVEETLHRVFRETRAHGEWFEQSPGLMSYIKSLID